MKSLLLKDYYAIRPMRWYLLIPPAAALISMFFNFFTDNSQIINGFAVGMTVVVSGIFSFSSSVIISSSDENSKFIYTGYVLPVTRKQYLDEKYLFTLIITSIFTLNGLIFGLLALILNSCKDKEGYIAVLLISASCFLLTLVWHIVYTALYLKFSSNIGMMLYPAVCFAISLIFKYIDKKDMDPSIKSVAIVVSALAAVLITVTAVLFKKSYKWAEEREV